MVQPIILLSPSPASFSETFIRAHYEHLPFELIPLYRWRFPYKNSNGQWIGLIPGVLRIWAELLRLRRLVLFLERWGQREVALWIKKTGACAILAEYGPLGACIVEACRIADIPLVVIFHGFDAYINDILERYHDKYSEMFASVAALVVVSEPMRLQLIQMGAPLDRIQVNPCGVDPVRFCSASPGSAPPHFLAIGRFVNKKGPLITIKAFSMVYEAEPLSRLLMIGAGPLLADCQQLASDLGLLDVINFVGIQPHSVVETQMRHVRAVVQHSIRCDSGDQEGTPVGLIEAQMAGLPVVSTKHGGIPNVVVDGSTGFLVQEGDVEGMAEAMLRLVQEPCLAAEMGLAARAHALKQHTMERHIQSLASTIHSAINRNTAAAII